MPRDHIGTEDRRTIAARALGRCEYCKSPAEFATQAFSVEHIVPLSRGGATKLENLALACPGCNGHKYAKLEAPDPIDGKIVQLYNPRTQVWKEHFHWGAGFTQVIGLTPVGRATVNALKLNRPGLLNMRRVLFGAGYHPPREEGSSSH